MTQSYQGLTTFLLFKLNMKKNLLKNKRNKERWFQYVYVHKLFSKPLPLL